MDGEIRSARALKASAGLRVRFSEAMSGASAPVAATVPTRPIVREPVIRKPKRVREPWTWTRALVPVGFLLIFALAIGLSLPRGGGNEGETLQPLVAAPPQQAEIVKLTFACEIASAFSNYGEWSKVITAFEVENPDIDVDIAALAFNATDAESYQQGLAEMAAKTDVFCAVPTVSDWQRGVVADLGPYIANDPQFNPDDFYAGLLRMTDDGHSLSVPTYFRPMLMKYNPELFDKAGVPYPRPGWTWDEFLAAAKALTVRDGDTVTQWGYYELGAGLFSARLRSGLSADLQSLPDYATAADILGWFEKLYVDDPAAPVESIRSTLTGEKVSYAALDDMLSHGKVAMSNVDMRSDRTEPRHLAPYPDTGYGILMSYFSDLVMSGQTAHPEEAWRLLSYLSRHLPDGEVPARRSLAEQASFWQRLDESSGAAYRYALEHLTPPSVGPLTNDYALYQNAAVAVATGKKTAAQALADLDAQVRLRGGPSATAETTVNQAAAAAATAQPLGSVTTLEFHCESFLAYEALYQVIEAFEAENPDVNIHYLPVGAGATDEASYQAGMADAAAKSDVFCAMPGLTELQRGVVADLAPYIADDVSFRPDDFYPGMIRPLPENGAIFSVPTYIAPSFISYDPQVFDVAGLPYPQPGWTWDDFLAAAVKLTQREGESIGRWGFYELGGAVFTGRLHAGWSADAQTPPDYAEMERILRWYEAMYVRERGAALPAALNAVPGAPISAVPLERLLKAGKAAMWDDGGANFMRGAGAQQAAYPEPNQGAFFGRMGELAMSGQTQHPDLAWRWISYLSQHLPDERIPARRSLAENASFWNDLDEASKTAYRYTLDHIAPANVRFPDEYQHYLDAVIAVAKGEKSVEQALADLHAQVALRGGP
jgi:ABC-type glycerol-3-phosphate transport system substrate-binding protein